MHFQANEQQGECFWANEHKHSQIWRHWLNDFATQVQWEYVREYWERSKNIENNGKQFENYCCQSQEFDERLHFQKIDCD